MVEKVRWALFRKPGYEKRAVRENLTTPPFFKPPALSAEPPETDVGHRHALASAESCRFG
jgi:hypothetical protein